MSPTPSIATIDDLFVSMIGYLDSYAQYLKNNDFVDLVGDAKG